jgi:hypothetical protein
MATNPQLVQAPAPAYGLFDSRAVALATFFGTPIAGASLMFANDRHLGKAGRGIMTLAAATLITLLVIMVCWNLPQGGSSIFGLAMLLGMTALAKKVQGPAVQDHVERGGHLASRWIAFVVALVFLAIVFGGIVVVYKIKEGPKVVIGKKDEVFYTGTATLAEAQALGAALQGAHYFQDNGVTVLLDKGAAGTAISFVVKDGIWDQPKMVSAFETIGRGVASAVGGLPVQVRLINKDRDVKLTSTVGDVSFGKDDVFYGGNATQAQAKALGQSLQSQGFFTGKGSDVYLDMHSDGVVVSFVVSDGVWEKPDLVADFEQMVRQSAPAVGGLPLHLHLLNTNLEVENDEPLN